MAREFLKKLTDSFGGLGNFYDEEIMEDFSDIDWWETEFIETSVMDVHNHVGSKAAARNREELD